MKKTGHLLARIALFAILSLFVVGQAWGQSSTARPAIAALADYTSGGSDSTDRYLSQVGFHHAKVPHAVWDQYPAVRKIGAAWSAAEAGSPNGGSAFLAAMSRALAQDYSRTVETHPDLKDYLRATTPDAPVTYARPDTPSLPPSGSPERKAISALADYTSGGTLGGAQSVMVNYFGTGVDDAYEILNSSASVADAYERATSSLSESDRTSALTRLSKDVAREYRAARYTPALLPFFPTEPPTQPPPNEPGPGEGPDHNGPKDGPPRPSSPNGRGPQGPAGNRPADTPPASDPDQGGPGRGPFDGPGGSFGGGGGAVPPGDRTPPGGTMTAQEVTENYDHYVIENYAPPSGGIGEAVGGGLSMAFSTMGSVIEGFGGIVFGNVVTSEATRPTSMRIDTAQDGRGLLVFSEHGHDKTYGPIDADEVVAAYALVYGHSNVIAGRRGVGLVSLDTKRAWSDYTCDPGPAKIKLHVRFFPVVLHPALANLAVGWAAVAADALPVRSSLVTSLATPNLPQTARDDVNRFFNLLEQRAGTWKLVDVPLTVKEDAETVFVQRTQGAKRYPEGLTRGAFVELRPFARKGDYDHELAERSYWLMPVLTQYSQDYAKMNSLAATVAVFRWLRTAGLAVPAATIDALHVPSTPTPAFVEVGDGGLNATTDAGKSAAFDACARCCGDDVGCVFDCLH